MGYNHLITRKDVDSMIRTLLFDFDGTIADSLPTVGAAMLETLKEYGQHDHTLAEMRKCIGPPLEHSFTVFFGLDEADCPRAVEIYRSHHEKLLDRYASYDGIPEALRELKRQGFTLAVATSKREKNAYDILAMHGTLELFDLVGGGMDGLRSGKEEVVRYVLDTLGASADETLMIGDRLYDVEGASALGLRTLGVLWGFGSKQELVDAGAFATVGTPAEMVDYLVANRGTL